MGIGKSRKGHKKNLRFLNIPKKGQMEMVGLVVIVILITLGMLFMAKFALKEDTKKKVFTRKGLAYSAMGALMKTTVQEPGCSSNYIGDVQPQLGKDILEDCANNHFSNPDGWSLYTCNGQHSCAFLETKIAELLNLTLGEWGKSYEFRSSLILQNEKEPVNLIGPITNKGGCPKWKGNIKDRDSSGLFPLHTDAGLVESYIYICD
jgi:hypothetical protein